MWRIHGRFVVLEKPLFKITSISHTGTEQSVRVVKVYILNKVLDVKGMMEPEFSTHQLIFISVP